MVEDDRIVRVDALGSVAEVQTRVREIINQKIDFKEIDKIEETDRMAETIRSSSFDWKSFEEEGL